MKPTCGDFIECIKICTRRDEDSIAVVLFMFLNKLTASLRRSNTIDKSYNQSQSRSRAARMNSHRTIKY